MRQLTRIWTAIRRWTAARAELIDELRERDRQLEEARGTISIQEKAIQELTAVQERNYQRVLRETQNWKPIEP